MSIVRIGLAETKNFSDGYDMIFGKKDGGNEAAKKAEPNEASGDPKKEDAAEKEKK